MFRAKIFFRSGLPSKAQIAIANIVKYAPATNPKRIVTTISILFPSSLCPDLYQYIDQVLCSEVNDRDQDSRYD